MSYEQLATSVDTLVAQNSEIATTARAAIAASNDAKNSALEAANAAKISAESAGLAAEQAIAPIVEQISTTAKNGGIPKADLEGLLDFSWLPFKKASVDSYAELRLYSGKATMVSVTGVGIQGDFSKLAPGSYVDNDGTVIVGNSVWGRLYVGAALASWFGLKGDGVTEETATLTKVLNFSSLGIPILMNKGMTCKVSKILVPTGAKILGTLNIRLLGDQTSEVAVIMKSNTAVEYLSVSTPGTDTAFDIVHLEGANTLKGLTVVSDVQRAGTGGIVARGNDVTIEHLVTKNIPRPFQAQNPSVGQGLFGIRINSHDITTYIRGIALTQCTKSHVGDGKMRVQDTRASKTPGHNGLLLISTTETTFGNLDIADAGEHGIRFGSSTDYPGNCKKLEFGELTTRNTGGCGFKVNPDLGELLEDCYVDHLTVENAGRGSTDGNNEALRITEFKGLTFGGFTIRGDCTVGIALGSGDGLSIGPVDAPLCRDRIIRLTDTMDETKGDFVNAVIGPINGSVTTDRTPFEFLYQDSVTPRKIGNVKLIVANVEGFTNYLMEVIGTVTTIGPVTVEGHVGGNTVPNVLCPQDDLWAMDITYKGSRYIGRAREATFGYPLVVAGPEFSQANSAPGFGTFAVRNRGTGGQGTFGGAQVFFRANSTRRAAAVASMQTGATDMQQGLAFLGQNGTVVSNESLIRLMVLKHNGAVSVPLLPVYANNAAAVTGGLSAADKDMYMKPTGELCVVV